MRWKYANGGREQQLLICVLALPTEESVVYRVLCIIMRHHIVVHQSC